MEALDAKGIDVVRIAYPDLMGSDRGRDILLHHLPTRPDTASPSAARSTTPAPWATIPTSPAVWMRACPTSLVRPT